MRNTSESMFDIFPWNQNFETGLNIVDEQHRKLVGIINRLALHLSGTAPAVEIKNVLEELVGYTDFHFSTEETIWEEYFQNDPWYEEHNLTHKSFIDRILVLKNELENNLEDDIVYKTVSFLSHWLAYHILDTDKRMAYTVRMMESGMTLQEAKHRSDAYMSGSMEVLIHTVLSMYDNLSVRTLDLLHEQSLRKKAETELLKSEEKWRFLLETETENIWDWDIGEANFTHEADEELASGIIDHSALHSITSIHPEDRESVIEALKDHIQGKSNFFTKKYRILDDNGHWTWVLNRGKIVNRSSEGQPLRMVGTTTDIRERELASVIFHHTSQPMFVCDQNLHILSVNPAFCETTGYSENDVIGQNPKFLTLENYDADFFYRIGEILRLKGEWNGELLNRRRNGDQYYADLRINTALNPNGTPGYYIALFTDITEKKAAEQIILKQANYDALTQLQNRHMFQIRLDQEILRSQRSKLPFALMFIDLDHFKEINDTLGHETGDIVLVEAARRLRTITRETDIVARYGGDEFTVILPDIKDIEAIDRIAGDIVRSLSCPIPIDESQQLSISASIGITLYPDDTQYGSDLLNNADQAMYLAKHSGRSRYLYFTPSMQSKADLRKSMIKAMKEALDLGHFEIHYQPIIDLQTGTIAKAEALLRWKHPVYGYISPAEFIPVAEHSGMIIPIGNWVQQETIRQSRIWKQEYGYDLQINVNLSAAQIKSSGQIEDYLNRFDGSGISGIVEITEEVLVDHDEESYKNLFRFKDAGIAIAINNYGSGYSSLANLKKFDIGFIKIDKDFVRNLTPESQNLTLCKAIITMAHTLNIKVIAEGIETLEQCKIVSDLECDYGQGYYFSHPLPADEFPPLLKRSFGIGSL